MRNPVSCQNSLTTGHTFSGGASTTSQRWLPARSIWALSGGGSMAGVRSAARAGPGLQIPKRGRVRVGYRVAIAGGGADRSGGTSSGALTCSPICSRSSCLRGSSNRTAAPRSRTANLTERLVHLNRCYDRGHSRHRHCARRCRPAPSRRAAGRGRKMKAASAAGGCRPRSCPICCSTHFTGIGLASTNRWRCNPSSLLLCARALARSPAKTATHISCISRGATLAVTEITPWPPSISSASPVPSSPL